MEILSGVFEGKTTGTPIALLIRNEDQRSKDYSKIMDTFRPGHADYVYWQKYGIRDYRGGGRSSARETAVRVAAAAIARKWLGMKYGLLIRGYMSQLGPIDIPFRQWEAVAENAFFAADTDIVPSLEEFMDKLRKSGDSVGARISVVAEGVPVGLGEPVYDRLDAEIAYAMMSINAVKGVEIGAGFAAVSQKGTEHSDEITPGGFLSNNAWRHSGWNFHRPGHCREHRRQTHLQHSARAPLDRQGWQSRPSSRLMAGMIHAWDSRYSDRRGDAGVGTDGPCLAPSCAKCGCRVYDTKNIPAMWPIAV